MTATKYAPRTRDEILALSEREFLDLLHSHRSAVAEVIRAPAPRDRDEQERVLAELTVRRDEYLLLEELAPEFKRRREEERAARLELAAKAYGAEPRPPDPPARGNWEAVVDDLPPDADLAAMPRSECAELAERRQRLVRRLNRGEVGEDLSREERKAEKEIAKAQVAILEWFARGGPQRRDSWLRRQAKRIARATIAEAEAPPPPPPVRPLRRRPTWAERGSVTIPAYVFRWLRDSSHEKPFTVLDVGLLVTLLGSFEAAEPIGRGEFVRGRIGEEPWGRMGRTRTAFIDDPAGDLWLRYRGGLTLLGAAPSFGQSVDPTLTRLIRNRWFIRQRLGQEYYLRLGPRALKVRKGTEPADVSAAALEKAAS